MKFLEQRVMFERWAPKPDMMTEVIERAQIVLAELKDFKGVNYSFLLTGSEEGWPDPVVFIVSCFANEQAYSTFRHSPHYQQQCSNCEKEGLLQSQPEAIVLKPFSGFHYRVKSELLEQQGAHIICASLSYKPGTRNQGKEEWKKVASYVEASEEETYTYLLLEDVNGPDMLCSFERYVTEEFLWDVHVKSPALVHNMEAQKDIRTGRCLRRLKLVDGFAAAA